MESIRVTGVQLDLSLALIDFLLGFNLELPGQEDAPVVRMPMKDFFSIAGPGSPYNRPTRNPRGWSQGVPKMLLDRFGIKDYEVRIEAGNSGEPECVRADGAFKAVQALMGPNAAGDLASISLEVGPFLNFLSPQPYGAIRKLFRSIASGEITEADLKAPVQEAIATAP